MAVTSLTGTTWYFNETLDLSAYPASTTIDYSNGTHYNINYTVVGSSQYTGFSTDNFTCGFYLLSSFPTQTTNVYRPVIVYEYEKTGNTTLSVTPYNYFSEGWFNNTFRTVIITGGTDVTNSNLIAWLEANATQLIELDYIDKVSLISGDEYYIKDTVSGYLTKEDILSSGSISISETSEGKVSISDTNNGIAGRFIRFRTPSIIEGKYWVIEDPTFSSDMNKTWNIDVSPGWGRNVSTFSGMKFDSSTGNISLENGSYDNTIISSDNARYDIYLDSAWNDMIDLDINGETESMGSGSPEYIYISGGSDSNDSTFITWLMTHAVQVHPLLSGVSGSVTVPAGTKLRLLGFNLIRYQEDVTFPFNFTSNNASYTGIKYAYASGESEYYYVGALSNTYITNYYTIVAGEEGGKPEYGFPNSAYRDLTITSQFTADSSTYGILYNAVVIDS